MFTLLPDALLAGAVEMACYFFTAVGMVLGFVFMPRG